MDAVNSRRHHQLLLGGWQTPSVPQHLATPSGLTRLARPEAGMAPQWEPMWRIAQASTLEDPYGCFVAAYTSSGEALEARVEEGEAPSRVACSAATSPVPLPELEPHPGAPPNSSLELREEAQTPAKDRPVSASSR